MNEDKVYLPQLKIYVDRSAINNKRYLHQTRYDGITTYFLSQVRYEGELFEVLFSSHYNYMGGAQIRREVIRLYCKKHSINKYNEEAILEADNSINGYPL